MLSQLMRALLIPIFASHHQIARDRSAPQVYSISYGGPEALNPPSSMNIFNTELCKLGLQGKTFFVASGDDGVAGSQARGSASSFYTISFLTRRPLRLWYFLLRSVV